MLNNIAQNQDIIPWHLDTKICLAAGPNEILVAAAGWLAAPDLQALLALDEKLENPVLLRPVFFPRADVDAIHGACLDCRQGHGFLVAFLAPANRENFHLCAVCGNRQYILGKFAPDACSDSRSFLNELASVPAPFAECPDTGEIIIPGLIRARAFQRPKELSERTIGAIPPDPRFSVIIAFNGDAGLLATQALSMSETTAREVEFIYILYGDNAGTLKSELSGLARALKIPVRIFRMTNIPGQAGAFNFGAKRATGEIAVFINQDMVPIVPDWLEILGSPLCGAPEAGAVYCAITDIYDIPLNSHYILSCSDFAPFVIKTEIPDALIAAGAAGNVLPRPRALAMHRRRFIERGGFDEDCFNFSIAASAFIRELSEAGFSCLYEKKPLATCLTNREEQGGATKQMLLIHDVMACRDKLAASI